MTFIASLFGSMDLLQIVGVFILLVGIIGTLFSSYRYLLVYMFAGMAYWVSMEALCFGLQQFGFSETNGYLSAIGLSMVAAFVWLAATEPQRQRRRAELHKESYIGHTAFEGEVPTSKG